MGLRQFPNGASRGVCFGILFSELPEVRRESGPQKSRSHKESNAARSQGPDNPNSALCPAIHHRFKSSCTKTEQVPVQKTTKIVLKSGGFPADTRLVAVAT